MKVKILSAVLLLVCFCALGVLSGVIPTRTGDGAPPEAAAVTASPAPKAAVLPTARTAPTPAPATPEPTPTATPEPTAEPSPEPTPETAEDAAELWEPDIEVISTTIRYYNDPLINSTDLDVDGKALMAMAPAIELSPGEYQVLIMHTHATEAYTPAGDDRYEATADYRTTDTDHSVVRVGRALAEALEGYGLGVLHDETLYDYPDYNSAYANAAAGIEAWLTRYPSIGMVIDLHRDAFGDEKAIYKTVSDAGEHAAQIMLVMGSNVNLYHPNWRDNLALAMSLQGLVTEQYPDLMRPTTLVESRYNQQLTSGSMIMEVGSSGNTMAEAIEAVELFAGAVGPALAARIGA